MNVKIKSIQFYNDFKSRILSECPLPDFKEKHLLTAPLRILIFLLTWVCFFLFYPEVWFLKPSIPFIFNLGFLITAICYWNIFKENNIFEMVTVEVFIDIICQTAILYLVGFDAPTPLLFYGLYVVSVGTLLSYFSGICTAFTCVCFYVLIFIGIKLGIIEAFHYPKTHEGSLSIQNYPLILNLLLLPLILGFVLYGLKIVHYFNQLKQRALERRHVQLTALNNIGSTIRRALQTQNVIEQVLRAVTKGLRFEVCLLGLVDHNREKMKFYVADENFYARKMQEILGIRFADLTLPLFANTNAIMSAIDRKRVVIRNSFTELTTDFTPELNAHKCLLVQSHLGFKKYVITPLIAEQKGIGVIIGISTHDYIEDTIIDTLDNFANQAALAIESAQLFEALEERNKELMRANQVKSDFLAIMSHELRTPLIAVIGYSEILLDKLMGELNSDQSNSVKEVLRNAKNLLELINSVLDLAKIESGKMELSLESLDLSDIVKDVQQTLAPLLNKKNLKFMLHVLYQPLPHFLGDAVKIRQILINLIGNAIKFTENGGSIEVDINYFLRAHEIIKTDFVSEPYSPHHVSQPAFTIRVRDTGIGIRPENLQKIFDVFSQVDATYTRTHEGTGLGLALTKQLVLLHSGAITVASEFGKGSEFKILLPQGEIPEITEH